MNKTSRSPCIIFLKGVNKDDYREVEDQFDQLLLESTVNNELCTTEMVYKELPPLFTSLENWPTSTNLHCWNCECTFTTRPIFIPLHIKGNSNGLWDMNTHGTFCSFSCAARYIKDFMDPAIFTNLFHLYQIFNQKEVKYIYASPRRYCVKKYGGHLTEGEYLEEIRRLENEIELQNEENNNISNQSNEYHSDDEQEMSVWQVMSKEKVKEEY